jgi:hypothetical protein
MELLNKRDINTQKGRLSAFVSHVGGDVSLRDALDL